jgi:predicted nucleic-acid-binding Zn-ribbon protein
MKRTGKCPKCGSTQIIGDVKAVDRGHHHAEFDMSLATFAKPNAILFKGKRTTDVSAWVCADCGFVELYAEYPQAIRIDNDGT